MKLAVYPRVKIVTILWVVEVGFFFAISVSIVVYTLLVTEIVCLTQTQKFAEYFWLAAQKY